MSRAIQIETLLAGVSDSSGNPLAAGKVYSYEAGTTTPKALYTDQSQSVEASNPVVLNSSGQAQVYANGSYKLVVKDSDDQTLYTWDNLLFGINDEGITWGDTTTGSSNAYVATPSPDWGAYNDGKRIDVILNFTNTSTAPTLNVSSLGAKTIKDESGNALQIGSLQSGQLARFIYESSNDEFRHVRFTALGNEEYLVASNAAGDGTIAIFKVSSSDYLSFAARIEQFIMKNNAALSSRNAANDGNIALIRADGNDDILLGPSAVISGLKMKNNIYIEGRNAADDGDVNLIKANASDQPEIDGTLVTDWVDRTEHGFGIWELDSSTTAAQVDTDIFDEDNHSAYSCSTDGTPQNITYTPSNGKFTIANAGMYAVCLKVRGYAAAGGAAFQLRLKINGITEESVERAIPGNDHGAVQIITAINVTAGQYLNFTHDTSDAVDIAATSARLAIWRVD